MSSRQNHKGLKDRIREAGSKEEIESLLKMGKDFQRVSDRTHRQWKRRAQQRLRELEEQS